MGPGKKYLIFLPVLLLGIVQGLFGFTSDAKTAGIHSRAERRYGTPNIGSRQSGQYLLQKSKQKLRHPPHQRQKAPFLTGESKERAKDLLWLINYYPLSNQFVNFPNQYFPKHENEYEYFYHNFEDSIFDHDYPYQRKSYPYDDAMFEANDNLVLTDDISDGNVLPEDKEVVENLHHFVLEIPREVLNESYKDSKEENDTACMGNILYPLYADTHNQNLLLGYMHHRVITYPKMFKTQNNGTKYGGLSLFSRNYTQIYKDIRNEMVTAHRKHPLYMEVGNNTIFIGYVHHIVLNATSGSILNNTSEGWLSSPFPNYEKIFPEINDGVAYGEDKRPYITTMSHVILPFFGIKKRIPFYSAGEGKVLGTRFGITYFPFLRLSAQHAVYYGLSNIRNNIESWPFDNTKVIIHTQRPIIEQQWLEGSFDKTRGWISQRILNYIKNMASNIYWLRKEMEYYKHHLYHPSKYWWQQPRIDNGKPYTSFIYHFYIPLHFTQLGNKTSTDYNWRLWKDFASTTITPKKTTAQSEKYDQEGKTTRNYIATTEQFVSKEGTSAFPTENTRATAKTTPQEIDLIKMQGITTIGYEEITLIPKVPERSEAKESEKPNTYPEEQQKQWSDKETKHLTTAHPRITEYTGQEEWTGQEEEQWDEKELKYPMTGHPRTTEQPGQEEWTGQEQEEWAEKELTLPTTGHPRTTEHPGQEEWTGQEQEEWAEKELTLPTTGHPRTTEHPGQEEWTGQEQEEWAEKELTLPTTGHPRTTEHPGQEEWTVQEQEEWAEKELTLPTTGHPRTTEHPGQEEWTGQEEEQWDEKELKYPMTGHPRTTEQPGQEEWTGQEQEEWAEKELTLPTTGHPRTTEHPGQEEWTGQEQEEWAEKELTLPTTGHPRTTEHPGQEEWTGQEQEEWAEKELTLPTTGHPRTTEHPGQEEWTGQEQEEWAEKELMLPTTGHPRTTEHPGQEEWTGQEQEEWAEKELTLPTTGHPRTTEHPGQEEWTGQEEEQWDEKELKYPMTGHPRTTEQPGQEEWTGQEQEEWAEKELTLPTTGHPRTTEHPGQEEWTGQEQEEWAEKELTLPTTGHPRTTEHPGQEEWTGQEQEEWAEKELRRPTAGYPITTEYPVEEEWTGQEQEEWPEKELRHPSAGHPRATEYPGQEEWTGQEEEEWAEKELTLPTTGHPGTTEYPGQEAWAGQEQEESAEKELKHRTTGHPGKTKYPGGEMWMKEEEKEWTEKEGVPPITEHSGITGNEGSERTRYLSEGVWKTISSTQGEWMTGNTVTSSKTDNTVAKSEVPLTSYRGGTPARVTTTLMERVEATVPPRKETTPKKPLMWLYEEKTTRESGQKGGERFTKYFQPTTSSKVTYTSSSATPWTTEQLGTISGSEEFPAITVTSTGETALPKEQTPQHAVRTNTETYDDIYSLFYLLYYPLKNHGTVSYLPYSEQLMRWWKDYYYYHFNNPSSNVDYVTYVWRHMWSKNPEQIELSSTSYNSTSVQFTTSPVSMLTSSSYRPWTTEELETVSSSAGTSEITVTPSVITYGATESTTQQPVSFPYGVSTGIKTHDYIYNLLYLLYYPLRNNSTISYLPYSEKLIQWWNNYYYHNPPNNVDYLAYVWMNMGNHNPDQIQPSSISSHYDNTSRWFTWRSAKIGQIMCYYPYKEAKGTLYHSCEGPSGSSWQSEEGKPSQPLGYTEYIPPYYPVKYGSSITYSDYWTYEMRSSSHNGKVLYTYHPFKLGSRIISYTPQQQRSYEIDQYDQGGRNYSGRYFRPSSHQGNTKSYFIYYPISANNETTYETTSGHRYTQWNHTFYMQSSSGKRGTSHYATIFTNVSFPSSSVSKYTKQVYNGSQVFRGKHGHYTYAYSTGEPYSKFGTHPLYYIYYPLQRSPQLHFYPFVTIPHESHYSGPRHPVTTPLSLIVTSNKPSSGERKLHMPSTARTEAKHSPNWVQGLPWMRLHLAYVPYSTNPSVCYIKLVPYGEMQRGAPSSSHYGFSWSTRSKARQGSYQSTSTNRTIPSTISTSYYRTYVSPNYNYTYGNATRTQPSGHYTFSVTVQNGTHGKPPSSPSGTQYRSSHITYQYGYAPSSIDNGTYFHTYEISNRTQHYKGNYQSYGMAPQNSTYWKSTIHPNGTRYIRTHSSYSYGPSSSDFQNGTYFQSYQIPSKTQYHVSSSQPFASMQYNGTYWKTNVFPNASYYNTSRVTYHYGQPSFNLHNRTYFHSFSTSNGSLHYMGTNQNHTSGGSSSFYNGTYWTTQTSHNTPQWQSRNTSFHPSLNSTPWQSYVMSPQRVQQGDSSHQTGTVLSRVLYSGKPSQNSQRQIYSTVYHYGSTNVSMIPANSSAQPSSVYYGWSPGQNSNRKVYSTVYSYGPTNVGAVSSKSGTLSSNVRYGGIPSQNSREQVYSTVFQKGPPNVNIVSHVSYSSGSSVPHNSVTRTRSQRSAPVEDAGIIEVKNEDTDNDTAAVYNSSKEETSYIIPFNESSNFELYSLSEKNSSYINMGDLFLERNATDDFAGNTTEKGLFLIWDPSNQTEFKGNSNDSLSIDDNDEPPSSGAFLLDNGDTLSIKDNDTAPIDHNDTYTIADDVSRDENETILEKSMDKSYYEESNGKNVTGEASNETLNNTRENKLQTEVKVSNNTKVLEDQPTPFIVNEDESISNEEMTHGEGSNSKNPIKFSLSVSMVLDTPDAE